MYIYTYILYMYIYISLYLLNNCFLKAQRQISKNWRFENTCDKACQFSVL